jgi:hypothetical protein
VGNEMLDYKRKTIMLKQCEAIIGEGIESMYKVDRAFSIISDMELYGRKYESFEAYCQSKWNIENKYRYLPSIKQYNKEKI